MFPVALNASAISNFQQPKSQGVPFAANELTHNTVAYQEQELCSIPLDGLPGNNGQFAAPSARFPDGSRPQCPLCPPAPPRHQPCCTPVFNSNCNLEQCDVTEVEQPIISGPQALEMDETVKPVGAGILIGRLLAQHHISQADQLSPELFNRLCTICLSANPSPLAGPQPVSCCLDEFDVQAAPQHGLLGLDLALDIVQTIETAWPFQLPPGATGWLVERMLKFHPMAGLPLIDRTKFIQLRDLTFIAYQVTAEVLKKLSVSPHSTSTISVVPSMSGVAPPLPGFLSIAVGSLDAHSSWDA